MSIEKTSAEFEAWFKERFWHECYEDVKHHLFAAWQASRESLVIELPPSHDMGITEPDLMMDSYKVISAVAAAGIKVKPCTSTT